MTLIAVVALLAAAKLIGQPAIGQNGVFNTASRIPPTAVGGAIARGALFTIQGVRLGSSTRTTAVSLLQNGTGVPVQVISVRDTQIDAVMPRSAPLGSASLVVTVDQQSSGPFSTQVVESNPGIFSRKGQGWGPGRIENLDSRGVRSINSSENPSRPLQRIRVGTTGLGSRKALSAVIGGRVVRVESIRSTGTQGEEELMVRVPADSPLGCYVPVYLQLSPALASNVVTMSIGSSGGGCEPGPVPMLAANRVGVVVLSHISAKARAGNNDAVSEEAAVTFAAKGDDPIWSPLLLLPPPGTCTAYTGSFQATTVLSNSISSALEAELGGRGLDAGPRLTLSREGYTRSIPTIRGEQGFYRARLGRGGAPFLEPGEYTLAGSGGKDIGSFQATVPAPSVFEWLDRDRLEVIDRTRPLTLHWRSAKGDLIVIVVTNVDQITTSTGACLCVARGEAGRLEIPADLLAKIPASINIPGVPYDQVLLASLPAKAPPPIRAPGLTGSAVVSLYGVGRIVEFR